jgi:hypothetical protein
LWQVERGVAMWEFDVEDLHGIERTMCFYRIFMGALLQVRNHPPRDVLDLSAQTQSHFFLSSSLRQDR